MYRCIRFFVLWFICVNVYAAKEHWQQMAQRDLIHLKHLIEENHPGFVDSKNPDFKRWFSKGYSAASARIKSIDGYHGHYFLLSEFINGFKDGHLNLVPRLDIKFVRWPGFILAKRKGQYQVHYQTIDNRFKKMPPVGAELVKCGKQTPDYFMNENVFPYFSRGVFPSSWIAHAPLMLIDFNNPFIQIPNRCEFRHNGKTNSYALHWQNVAKSQIWPVVKAAGFGKRMKPNSRKLKNNQGHWITIPTFALAGEHVNELQHIIRQLPSFQNNQQIVLDMRGNSGGSTEWGDRILKSLFGPIYVAYMESELDSGKQYIEYRASKSNYQHFKAMLPMIAEQYGSTSRFYKHFVNAVKGLEQALLSDKPFYRSDINMKRAINSYKGKIVNPVKGKVFVLTDGACGSACLGFLDKLLQADNVIHVGLPTSGDTIYMDLNRAQLPSGLFILNYATKVYRNRIRGHNEFYTPKHLWQGNMTDTNAIEQWIETLEK